MNMIDKAISYIFPTIAAKRAKARALFEFFNSYDGASKTKRSLKEWSTLGNDPDSDILDDLDTLRSRSRDLVRNNPLASGAIKTKVTNVVGTGLVLRSHIDRDALGVDENRADAWEKNTEREWRLFWESKDCDVERTKTGLAITKQVYQQQKENGDVFILLPAVTRKNFPYNLKLQVIEADRVCNPNFQPDTETLAGGIEKDKNGAPIAYHFSKYHPGDYSHGGAQEYTRIQAFGPKTGLRNVIHVFNQTRPGQSRGVPDLASVIEPLKQLGKYTDAELMAAVISGFFTVFIQSESGETPFDYSNLGDEVGRASNDKDYKLGNGLIMELGPGEKVHDSNPGRPNDSFDNFVLAILRQIGVALEIPFEILIKHFTASYSAARAALNEFWKYVLSERKFLYDNFLSLVYERWLWEAVSIGRIDAPGFFTDPAIRKAYLGCDFIGPSKGQINEEAEVKAASARVDSGFSTLSIETAQLTGGDWEKNHEQQTKERKKRLDAGLIDETQ